jgi:hypothetical protein
MARRASPAGSVRGMEQDDGGGEEAGRAVGRRARAFTPAYEREGPEEGGDPIRAAPRPDPSKALLDARFADPADR